nr:hypothetical protein [Caballeronia choica]
MCEATLEGHTSQVTALKLLGDGRLASGSRDRTIRVWHVHNGHWTGEVLFVSDSCIEALAFAVCTEVLAAGDRAGRIHFLKVEGDARVTSKSPPPL